MDTIFQKELMNIGAAYDLLQDSLESLKKKILQDYIPECSKSGKIEEIQDALQMFQQVESHINDIIKLRTNYSKMLGNIDVQDKNNRDIKNTAARTTWAKEDEYIRVTTTRPDGKSNYTNLIPISVFEEIVETILNRFVTSGHNSIDVSIIYKLLNDKVKQKTTYKKASRTLIYSVIKILVKEDILENKEDARRIYVLKKSPSDVEQWLKNIVN